MLARELLDAGAEIIDIGGESGVTNRPPVDAEEETARVVPVIEHVARELGAIVSVDTYKPRGGERGDRSRRGDRQRRQRAARPGARGRVRADRRRARRSCTRARRPSRSCSTPRSTATSRRTSSASCTSGSSSRSSAGVDIEQLMLDPGPDFGKTPGADGRGAPGARAAARAAAGRCCWPSRARTSSARSPRARRGRGLPGTLAAVGFGVDAGAHVLRVHDVAAVAEFLAVRAALGGERRGRPASCGWRTSFAGSRAPRPGAPRPGRYIACRIAGRCPNAAGANRFSTGGDDGNSRP